MEGKYLVFGLMIIWLIGLPLIRKKHSKIDTRFKDRVKKGSLSFKGIFYITIWTIIIFGINIFIMR
jgi:hypothetical protein